MELKNGPLSIPQIFIGGLKIANRAFGAALALFILLFLLGVLLGITAALITWIFPRYALLFQIPLSLCNALLGVVTPLALIQIIASKIEKLGLSPWDSLTNSIVPGIYFFLSSLILTIPTVIVLAGAFLSHSATVIIAVCIILGFVMLPFLFTQQTIALRAEGPISALRYSWQLATAHYVRVLLTLLTLFLTLLIVLLGIVCLIKAFFPLELLTNQMLLQAKLLQMPKLYLLLGSVVMMALYTFVLLFIQSVFTILFLNLDYCHRSIHSREMDMSVNGNSFSVNLGEVQVKQASVQANASDADTSRHLEQVYSAQEHLAQAIFHHEDRMPTLLFDEEMTKKLDEQDQKLKEKKQSSNTDGDDDPPSIKISK